MTAYFSVLITEQEKFSGKTFAVSENLRNFYFIVYGTFPQAIKL